MKIFIRTHQRTNSLIIILAVIFVIGLAGHREVGAGPHVQEMRGTWFGFIQGGHDPVESAIAEINEQENRRFRGVIDAGGPHVIEGTVSASGKVNYQSDSAGHLVGKAELHDFGGGAAILDGTLTRPSIDDRFIIPCVRVLRAFAPFQDAAAPTGRYVGEMDGGEEMTIMLGAPRDPVSPTSLGGELEVVIDGIAHSFVLVGTFSEDGRIVAIGHKATHGHLILDARLASPPDPVQPSFITGRIEIELGDGSVREAEFQAEFSRGIVVVDAD